MEEYSNQNSPMRQQPSAVEVERAVLGAVMLERTALDKVADTLQPECFYDKRNQVIFEAMISLYQS
ncbi:MAG: replicative DNA helicase, partial [Ignavibacteriae bacterium]|nr:replicative DNA helicase [Ignavibacteriota bacterium]